MKITLKIPQSFKGLDISNIICVMAGKLQPHPKSNNLLLAMSSRYGPTANIAAKKTRLKKNNVVVKLLYSFSTFLQAKRPRRNNKIPRILSIIQNKYNTQYFSNERNKRKRISNVTNNITQASVRRNDETRCSIIPSLQRGYFKSILI